jgi:hypothetical protein
MADKTQKFKGALEKELKQLQKKLDTGNFTREQLLVIQNDIFTKLQQKLNEEEFRIIKSANTNSSDKSSLQEITKNIATTIGADAALHENDEIIVGEQQPGSLNGKKSHEINEMIEKLAPPINIAPLRVKISEAISQTDGLPDEDKNKMVEFLSSNFRDKQTSKDKDNNFLEWAEKKDQQKANLKKLEEEEEDNKHLMERRNKYLGRDDISLVDKTEFLAQPDAPAQPTPPPANPTKQLSSEPPPPPVAELTKEEKDNLSKMKKERIAAEEEATQLNPQNIGGKKRKKTKKKKKSKKRKTKRRYKTGKRN